MKASHILPTYKRFISHVNCMFVLLGCCISQISYAEAPPAQAMQHYVIVTLLTGPAEISDKDALNKLFAGHFANMRKLAEENKLLVAGPISNALPKRGIFIFNTASIEEASEWVKSDPAVQAGIFDFEAVEFYSSAALLQVNEIHLQLTNPKPD